MSKKKVLYFIYILIGVFCLYFLFSPSYFDASSKFNNNEDEFSILFVGDMMFDRTIRKRIRANDFDFIFSCVKDKFQSYDLVVANLEGPITNNNSLSEGTVPGDDYNMKFTFPLDTSKYLYRYNVKAVSLANNHIFDFGRDGVEQTREALQKSKVKWFGDPIDKEKKTLVLDSSFLKMKDKSIAIVGFNQFLGVDGVEKTKEEIKNKKASHSIVIVFAHWGEEYSEVSDYQRDWARDFIDSGADLIIGSHPHVMQKIETYKGKKIYYSLGNFIFDQWWEESVRKGMGVDFVLRNGNIHTKEVFFESDRDGRTCEKE